MEALAIFALITKGISVVSALLEAGQTAQPALVALTKLVTGAQTGTVTAAEMAQTDALLDSLLEDFNLELPLAKPGDPDYLKVP